MSTISYLGFTIVPSHDGSNQSQKNTTTLSEELEVLYSDSYMCGMIP